MPRALILPLAIAFLAFSQGVPPAALPLRLIVVNSESDAAKILEQLRAGADFAVLAREKSVDATSEDGGLLGKVDPSTLRAELRAALHGLGPGQLSAVFRIPSGYAILKVLPESELAGIEGAARARQTAVRAEGSIHFDFDISGLNETEAALANFPKPAGWNLDLAQACSFRQQSLAAVAERAAHLLDAPDPNRSATDIMSVLVARGQLHAYSRRNGPGGDVLGGRLPEGHNRSPARPALPR